MTYKKLKLKKVTTIYFSNIIKILYFCGELMNKRIIFKAVTLSLLVLLFAVLLFSFSACKKDITVELMFNSNGGSEVPSFSWGKDDTLNLPETPQREGYVFGGWFFDDGVFSKPLDENSIKEISKSGQYIVYAKWTEEIYYTYVFYNDTTELKRVRALSGSVIALPETPNKESAQFVYTFLGWSPSVPTELTENINFYAQFSQADRYYTVTFVCGENADITGQTTQSIAYGQAASAPTVARAGYDFLGWDKTFDIVESNLTVNARWSPALYSVALQTSDPLKGTATGDCQKEYGEQVTVTATPVSDSFGFEGWYQDGTLVSSDLSYTFSMPLNNLTLTAKWVVLKYDLENLFVNAQNDLNLLFGYDLDENSADLNIVDSDYLLENFYYDDFVGIEKALILDFYYDEPIPIAFQFADRNSIPEDFSKYYVYYAGVYERIGVSNLVLTDMLSLKHILFGEFTTEGDAVYSKDGSVLIKYNGSETAYDSAANILSIGSFAFTGNQNLKTVVLNNVTNIGGWAFYYCENLTSVNILSSVSIIADDAFCESYNLSNFSVSSYGDIEVIGNEAFYSTSIKEFTIGANVSYLGQGAFKYSKISSLIIENGLDIIRYSTFQECPNLCFVNIPASVTEIESLAFKGCSLLIEVTFAENSNLKSIGYDAFAECVVLLCVTIPKSVETIGENCFNNCLNLSEVRFEAASKLNSIGANAFRGCLQLYFIALPAGLEYIGESAFFDSALRCAVIPNSVLEIGFEAFYGAVNIEIYCAASSAPIAWHEAWSHEGNNVIWNYLDVKYEGTAGLIYELNLDGTGYFVSGCIEELDDFRIKIPAVFNGLPVLGIKQNAFQNSYAYAVTIPQSVISIDEGAFGFYITAINFLSISPIPLSEIPSDLLTYNIFVPVGFCNAYQTAWNTSMISEVNQIINDTLYVYFGDEENVVVPNGVIEIGQNAFIGLKNLKSITIPSTVAIIGIRAFGDCVNLETVIFEPNSICSSIEPLTFYNCYKLKSIVIPSTVTKIGASAFYKCYSLTTADIVSDSLIESIDENAFEFCYSLESIFIPSNVTIIDNNAFNKCMNLESVTFGADSILTFICSKAFSSCYSLISFVLPDSVEEIGDYAFEWCYSLTTFMVTENSLLKTIGTAAFNSSSFTEFFLPKGLTDLGAEAFKNCNFLEDIIFAEDILLNTIKGHTFSSTIITNLTLPSSITTVMGNAFAYMWQLTSIDLSKTTISIIPEYCFNYCQSLPLIILPSTVTSIGYYAFYKNSSLEKIVILSTGSVPTLHTTALPIKTKIYVPYEKLTEYKSTGNWIAIADRIFAMPRLMFETNGGTMADPATVNYPFTATVEPTAPTKDGFTFDGWYSDQDLTTKFVFGSAIDADTTVYAKWI